MPGSSSQRLATRLRTELMPLAPLRRHVRRTLDTDRQRVYAVPYWRSGKDEDAYHQDRHVVMDS